MMDERIAKVFGSPLVVGTSTLSFSADTVDGGLPSGSVLGSFTMPDFQNWQYTLTDNAGGRLALDGNRLIVGAIPFDHRATSTLSVTVKATSGAKAVSRTQTIAVRQPLPKDASSLTFASNRVSFPLAIQTAAVGDRSGLGHTYHVAPEYGITGGMRLLFCNFYVDQSGSFLPEKKPGNSKTIDFATVFVNGVTHPVTFGGAESAVIADGGFVWSDIVMAGAAELTMPARQAYYVRVSETVAQGARRVFNAGSQLGISRFTGWSTGEGVEYTAAPQTAKKTTGTVGAFSNGTQSLAPHMIVAKGWDGSSVYAIFGDSIGASQSDGGTHIGNRGVIGHIGRALDDIASGRRSYANFCAPGTKPQDQSENADGQMALRLSAIKALPNQPFNTVISRMGQNGIFLPHASSFPQFGSSQPENLQKAMSKWWAFLRTEFAANIFQLTFTPRTQNIAGSNAFWTDPALQTPTDPAVDSLPDGTRARFNGWLLEADNLPAYVKTIDDRQAFFSPDTPFAWRKIEGEWTVNAAIAAGVGVNTAVVFAGAVAPAQGDFFVIEPSAGAAEVRQSCRVTGTGPWQVFFTGNYSSPHAAGVTIKAASTGDGLHPAHSLHMLAADILIAAKVDGTLP